ncbi:leucyl aminopeptidase family protein [Fluviibacterium sp. S390]|uniref:leucyl aminopeptidase family protein n=1 Tax=Fluviibacterium sp. S390 TaxID=3415139 RepID=UPI003C7C5B6F
MELAFAQDADAARPLHLVGSDDLERWLDDQPETTRTWLTAVGFTAELGQVVAVPGADGSCSSAVFGLGTAQARARGRFWLGRAPAALPAGDWALVGDLAPEDAAEAALAWLLAGYRFTRYSGTPAITPRLVVPKGVDGDRIQAIAAGEALTRDLINTPASDMGPAELEQAAVDVAAEFGAAMSVTTGDDLLEANFPMIHAVGRASPRAPRLIDMRWGSDGPRLTLVGKGVCFDTGGLNLKSGASMGLMKKDMGGAAAVLGLARMIMALDLPVQLRVLIPAVENAVSGASFRPQDILTSRKGLTVEINNTDAEGRLVLADALALADEEKPDLLISMATLTGAARVAVGPDIAPFFTRDDAAATTLASGAAQVRDPVWRLPLHDPYEPMIEPGVADLDNAPKGGFAGATTAALFLHRFVEDAPRYVHFDIYGWQPVAAPSRPKGGVGQGTRAVLAALPSLLDLPA